MPEIETVARLILLNILMYQESERKDEDLQKMIKDIIYDLTIPKQYVSEQWLKSHNFL